MTELINYEIFQNPAMDRAQKALIEQLKSTELQLGKDLLVRKDELKFKGQIHQQVGVQLYQLQQRIKSCQENLDSSLESFQSLVDSRLEEEEYVKTDNYLLTKLSLTLEDLERDYQKSSSELSMNTEALHTIEKYIAQIDEEISLSKRVANKHEHQILKSEIVKETQDLYLSRLLEEIHKLSENLMHTTTLSTKRQQEIEEITSILNEIETELSSIATEKNQLMTNWKNTLIGLGRRDEAVSKIRLTISNIQNSVHDINVALNIVRSQIEQEQKQNETLVTLRDRLQNELNWMEESITKIMGEINVLQDKQILLSKSLLKTEEEDQKLNMETKQLNSVSDSTIFNVQKIIRERQSLEEENEMTLINQAIVNKVLENWNREKLKGYQLMHAKENEAITIENELVSSKVEGLKLKTTTLKLEEINTNQTEILKEKENIIGKSNAQIRSKNESIEKKMHKIDRLNRKYEQLLEATGGEENLGFLESKLKVLQDNFQNVSDECNQIERQWLSQQSDMINILGDIQKYSVKNTDVKSRISLLSEQQKRLLVESKDTLNEIKSARQQNADLRKEILKLNSIISSGDLEEMQINSSINSSKISGVEELNTIRNENEAYKSTLKDLKNSKFQLLNEMKDMDEKTLLWQKKIQLEKETSDMLNPMSDQSDIEDINKDVNRMITRLEAVKKEQICLSIEMENAVLDRGLILRKCKALQNNYDGKTGTKMVSNINNLKSERENLEYEVLEIRKNVEINKSIIHEMEEVINHLRSETNISQENKVSLNKRLNSNNMQKCTMEGKRIYFQKFLEQLKLNDKQLNEDTADSVFTLSIKRITEAVSLISQLKLNHNHLEDLLQRVEDLARLDNLIDINSLSASN